MTNLKQTPSKHYSTVKSVFNRILERMMYISSNTIAFLHNQTLCFCTTCETTDIKHCPFFIYGWKMKHIKRSPLKRKKLLLICKKLFLPNKICVHKSLFYWKISMHIVIVFFFFIFFFRKKRFLSFSVESLFFCQNFWKIQTWKLMSQLSRIYFS